MNQWELPQDAGISEVLEWVRVNEQPDRILMACLLRQEKTGLKPTDPGAVDAAIRLLGCDLLCIQIGTGWPCIKYFDSFGLVFIARFSKALIGRLSDECDSFFDWRHCEAHPLPEDLCLLKEGNPYPALASVTHERDAWIFTDKEVDIPGVTLSEFPPEDSEFVFDRENYFIRDGRLVLSSPEQVKEGIILVGEDHPKTPGFPGSSPRNPRR